MRSQIPGGVAWGWDLELAATQIEMTHALLVATMAAAGAKRRDLPDLLHIDRPFERKREPRRASVKELAALMGPVLGGPNG